ncbi:MAG: hypothetical protein ACXAD7_28370, partial [Candidatus Kariarchaeaceae archaeon]
HVLINELQAHKSLFSIYCGVFQLPSVFNTINIKFHYANHYMIQNTKQSFIIITIPLETGLEISY